ncbi:MAG: polysaccharide biosynthesis tyrosine autokinase [Synechococcaceae cyanobacterium]|nr:polysaccharide biosynthesis tyrosine autokinase [Synechococcaceae cyanobacterium]
MSSPDEDRGAGLAGLVRTIKRRQGIFLFTFVLVSGALAVDTLRQRIFSPVYEGGFQMQISNPFESGTRSTSGGSSGSVEEIANSTYQSDVPSLVVLLRSPLLIRPLALKQGVSMGEVMSNLTIGLAAEDVKNVLNVNLRWRDPNKGRQILTQLSQEYTKFSLTERQAALDSGVRFLDKQAPDLLRRVETLQAELRVFRERNSFLEPAAQGSAIQSSRDGLVASLRELQLQQANIQSQIASVKAGRLRMDPSGAPSADRLLGPTSLATAPRRDTPGGAEGGGPSTSATKTPNDQLFQLEQELATAKATYREDSPIVQSLKARRDSLLPIVQRQYLDSLMAQLLANAAQQDELNRQILLLNDNFRTSPRKIKEFEDLQQRLSVARDNYSSYIRARERFRLEMARSTTPWQIIAPAEFNDVPVEPNIQRNLLRALLIGLVAALAAAVLRERTDHVFHTPMEVERELQLPVLGLIPYLPLDPSVDISTSISKMSASERFAIKESLRSLFTTFRLLRADRNIRLVGVTSSTQGEGKSTAVTVFARTLADLGMKVLIVDADMRLPMQNRYLGVDQGEGLSTMLADPAIKPDRLIQPIQDNLDVIAAGPKPPDPARLLNSSRCAEVVEEIRALPGYDIVIFDAPPCLMLADPILLGEKLDGILFLVGLGKVSRDLAPQAARRIKATGVDVLGLICNQVNFPSRLNDYGYEYGYYYHYSYAGSYGKSRYGGYGTYGTGLKTFVRRYRDSYMGNRYSDSYMTRGAAAQSRSRELPPGPAGQPPSAQQPDAAPRSYGPPPDSARGSSGPLGWLRDRLPGGSRRRR